MGRPTASPPVAFHPHSGMTHIKHCSFAQTYFFLSLEKWLKLVPKELWPHHGTIFSMEFNKSLMLHKSKKKPWAGGRGWVASGHQVGYTGAEKGGETLSQEGPRRKTNTYWTGRMYQSLSKGVFWKFNVPNILRLALIPHITQEETEAERGSTTWPSSHGQQEVQAR